jgi:arylsulfatase A-like enzyme
MRNAALAGIVSRFAAIAVVALSVPGAIGFASAEDAAKKTRQPNIVLIFADDLGWKDVGYNGTEFYETPNIDRFRKEGMAFHAAYVGGANCQPSRACLMSGQYTPRHDVYAVGSTDRGPRELMRLTPVPNKPYLEGANYTMAEALHDAGYATAHFAKWHLNQGPGTLPTDQGFDISMKEKKEGSKGKADDPKRVFGVTEQVGKFMEENKDRPFFAYVAHNAVHTPHQARGETLSKYESKKPGKLQKDPLYAACIADFDESVGQLLAKIKELGLEENTIVVFTSDNGGTPITPQEPLRGNKGAYYEGGIREPFVVRWPGKVKPNSSCNVPVMTIDLYPTFLAAAGAKAPSDKILDGESLLPLLEGGDKLARQSLFWHFPGYLDTPVIRGRDEVFRTRPVSVIRKGDWKLLLYHEEWLLDGGRDKLATNRAVELYNLADDEGERDDVSNSNTAKRDELLGDLLAWFKATDAKLPTERTASESPSGTSKKAKKKRFFRKLSG